MKWRASNEGTHEGKFPCGLVLLVKHNEKWKAMLSTDEKTTDIYWISDTLYGAKASAEHYAAVLFP